MPRQGRRPKMGNPHTGSHRHSPPQPRLPCPQHSPNPHSHIHIPTSRSFPVLLSVAILALLGPAGAECGSLPSGLRRVARPLSFAEVAALRHAGAGALPRLQLLPGRGFLGTGVQGQSGVEGRKGGSLEEIRRWFGSHDMQSISGGSVSAVSSKASEVSREARASVGAGALRREQGRASLRRERPGTRRGLLPKKKRKRLLRTKWAKRWVRRGRRVPRGKKKNSGGTSGTVMPTVSPSSVLKYFGGPVAVAPIQVHLIYYGNWANTTGATGSTISPANSTNSTASDDDSDSDVSSGSADSGQGILRGFLDSISLGGEPVFGSVAAWWKVMTMFGQKDGQVVSSRVTLASETYDNYTEGSSLEDDREQVFRVLQRHFDSGVLEAKAGHMYLVLTSPDVTVGPPGEGFCGVTSASYCGWHDVNKYSKSELGDPLKSTSIYYGFVGNPVTQCPNRCMTNGLEASPNGNPGVDAMVDTLAHELAEMATNPDTSTGWMTSDGKENADLCRGEYYLTHMGGTFPRDSYLYNLDGAGGKKYLVQATYNPVKAACTISP